MGSSKYIKLSYLKKNPLSPIYTIVTEPYNNQTTADARITALDDPTVATNFNTVQVDYD